MNNIHDQLELDEWAKEHAHHNPHDSEIAAAEKAFLRAGTLKEKIYNLLLAAGNAGMTPEEISNALGYNTSDGGNTVRRRMIDLQKSGMIRHHPELITRTNKAGNEALVWVVGSDPNNQKTKIQILQDRVRDLRMECMHWRDMAVKQNAALEFIKSNTVHDEDNVPCGCIVCQTIDAYKRLEKESK